MHHKALKPNDLIKPNHNGYMPKPLHLFLAVLFCITAILWLSSYSHHTSFGIDHDSEQQNKVLHTFYRINWTGHGSLWVGYGSIWKEADKEKPLEKFDLAATAFQPYDKPINAYSVWNKLGFWFIYSKAPKPSFWVGVPSWLPVLILMVSLFILWRRTHSL